RRRGAGHRARHGRRAWRGRAPHQLSGPWGRAKGRRMDAKAGARERVRDATNELLALSHRIHAHPELGFEEVRAADWLGPALTDAGFAVEPGICDLPTAFRAHAGAGPLHLAICAEYDCLPGIGHACGHNIIAASAIGAALALARVADDVGLTVTVVGTP